MEPTPALALASTNSQEEMEAMTYEEMMSAGGYAETHCKAIASTVAARLLEWCGPDLTALQIGNDEEADDWNQRVLATCNGMTSDVRVALHSEGGLYRWEFLATSEGTPVDFGFTPGAYEEGTDTDGILALVAQIAAIGLYATDAARAVYNTMNP